MYVNSGFKLLWELNFTQAPSTCNIYYSKVNRETVDYGTCKVCRTGKEMKKCALVKLCYMIAEINRENRKMDKNSPNIFGYANGPRR